MPKDMCLSQTQACLLKFKGVRNRSLDWTAGLAPEDLCVQTMNDVSPGKWHLAHVTWFWETFVLKKAITNYKPFDDRFCYLFNSYYNLIGKRHERHRRGFINRPYLSDILAYRHHVDQAICDWLQTVKLDEFRHFQHVIDIGLNHEQQHQELFLTDIKHVFSQTIFSEAVYRSGAYDGIETLSSQKPHWDWKSFPGGVFEFGHCGAGFAFDVEGPRHKAYLTPFDLATRPVTNGQYLSFIEDAGYEKPEFWLADGWDFIQLHQQKAPFYWRKGDQGWREFTLHGLEDIQSDAPVSHLSYFEAAAFANWSGWRLPSEREWELAAHEDDACQARWAEPGMRLHPVTGTCQSCLSTLFGEVWEWTSSSYETYPGFQCNTGAIGEYNAKFTSGQYVLRGGSCLSPPDHVRPSYRNFLTPGSQWQMTGLRLARDI